MLKKTLGDKAFNSINYLVMIILCIICLYPLVYVLFASISIPSRLAAHRGILLYPLGFTLKGYDIVFQNPHIFSGYMNTLIYVSFGTIINVVMTCIAAYVMSRKEWMWSGNLTVLVLIHMFFGGGLIPFYLLIRELGIMDTRWALLIPGAINVWNLIVLRTAFAAVPQSLIESARIDGANDLFILFRIVIPVSMAAVAVQILFYSVGHWNAWFNAMIFIRNRKLLPIQVILREILIANNIAYLNANVSATNMVDINQYGDLVKYCTIIVATLPILFVYPYLQKHFVKGVMIGSIKG